jgi:hypothetical protein
VIGAGVHRPGDAPHGFPADALVTRHDAFELEAPSGRLERETPHGPAGR